ncbi:MAG: hypothetical protein ACN6O7_02655 [Sphingobacterium sp.]
MVINPFYGRFQANACMVIFLLLLCVLMADSYGQSNKKVVSLESIQQRYAGKWAQAISYIKKVDINQYGRQDSSIQYHAYSYPKFGRVDQGSIDDGNAVIIQGDISYSFKRFKKVSHGQTMKYFTDYMLGDIYYDDVAGFKKVLTYSQIDFNLRGSGIWEGRAVTIIGATSTDDRYNVQVWYDTEHLYPVRFIDGRTGRGVRDIQYHIKPLGICWFPESAKEFVSKKQVGTVRYLHFSSERKLAEEIFDPERFGSFHWAQ